MKIQTDQVTALNQTSGTDKTRSVADEANPFGEILAREIGASTTQAGTYSVPPLTGGLGGVSGLFGAGEVESAGNLSEKERAVMENVDVLLNQWENYADSLASGGEGSGLKQAYGVLEDIESGVRKIKDDLPQIGGANSEIASLVNELEVMTVTEKIKFNRGDYI